MNRVPDNLQVQRQATRAFKSNSLQLRADTCSSICAYVLKTIEMIEMMGDETVNYNELVDKLVIRLIEVVKERSGHSTSVFVEKKDVDSAIEAIEAGDVHSDETKSLTQAVHGYADDQYIKVVSSFNLPQFFYQAVRKTFYRNDKKRTLLGNASDKARVFGDRFDLLLQRLKRNKLFTPSSTKSMRADSSHYEITSIDSLLGSVGKKCIFGLLSEIEEGKWFIEDTNTHIQLDLENAHVISGIFCDGCFALVEGKMHDGVFVVDTIGCPPPEHRDETVKSFPQLDLFGIDENVIDLNRKKQAMKQALEAKDDACIIILSEIHLDDEQDMKKLNVLLSGFADIVPDMVVIHGDFFSKATSTCDNYPKLKKYFDSLADTILHYPTMAQRTKFVFIPGPNDPNVGNILPSAPLIPSLVSRLQTKLKHAQFTSNPARLAYFGQEFVFFRSDLLSKMRRNAVLMSEVSDNTQLTSVLAETVVSQAHLTPINITKQPIFWQHDHALRLYPLPQVLIIADSTEEYEWEICGCKIMNPGSFHQLNRFIVYYPASGSAEFSEIPKDAI